MAEPFERHTVTRDTRAPATHDGRGADLLAPRLPAGEPVGPTGNQRDEIAVIRRRSQEVEF